MRLVKFFRRVRKDTSGVAAMEYGLIAGFIGDRRRSPDCHTGHQSHLQHDRL